MNLKSFEYIQSKYSVYNTLIAIRSQVEQLLFLANSDYSDADSDYRVDLMYRENHSEYSINRSAADSHRLLWTRLAASLQNLIDDIEGTKP